MSPLQAAVSEALSLSLLLKHAPVILFATDAQGHITLSEGQGLQALGLQPSEMVGQSLVELYAHQGDASLFVAGALGGEQCSSVLPWDDRQYHVHLQPLRDAEGRQVGLAGVAVDITAQVQAGRQAQALLRLSELLNETEELADFPAALGAVLAALAQVMPLDALILWSPDAEHFYVAAEYGTLPDDVRAYTQGGVPVEQVQMHFPVRQPAYWVRAEFPPALQALELFGLALLPLPEERERPSAVSPVLCAYRTQQPRPWTPGERALLEAAARSLAVIRGRRRRMEALEAAARLDPLTGLGNRRAFDHDLALALLDAQGQRAALGVLTADVDHLKRLNDTRGHAHGDALLRDFGQALQRVLRAGDGSYRLGGDEFVALLPGVAAAQIPDILQRVEQAVEALRETDFPELSVSAGVACFPQEAPDAATLLQLADERMYRVKAARRRD